MNLMETERLAIRLMSIDDAAFILTLVNEPSWLQFIGDRGVRTIEDAQAYIRNGPLASYSRSGFGFYLVGLKTTATLIGMCGLVKRDYLDDVDIGYAFLPAYWGNGYAFEAASAVMEYGRDVLDLPRVVAITTEDNDRSARLLHRLGMHHERLVHEPQSGENLRLFVKEFHQSL